MYQHTTNTSTTNASQAYLATGTRPSVDDDDHSFIRMLGQYRSSGGLARAKEVFTMFRCRNGLGAATLAQWMAQRRVLCMQWQAEVWLPLFQFEQQYMTIKPALDPVFATLNPIFTPWELAHWCAQPHRLLDCDSPANTLDANAAGVLRAACADRSALR